MSALGLQRVLGLRSYQTAWAWLHKFRRAMVRPGRDKLFGVVEVDETYVGGEEEGAKGRYTARKAIVAVTVELEGSKAARIRLRRIPDVKAKTLTAFVPIPKSRGALSSPMGGADTDPSRVWATSMR